MDSKGQGPSRPGRHEAWHAHPCPCTSAWSHEKQALIKESWCHYSEPLSPCSLRTRGGGVRWPRWRFRVCSKALVPAGGAK